MSAPRRRSSRITASSSSSSSHIVDDTSPVPPPSTNKRTRADRRDARATATTMRRSSQHNNDNDNIELSDNDNDQDDNIEEDASSVIIAPTSNRNVICGVHPRGVKPLGNQLFDGRASIRHKGLGSLGKVFGDAELVDFVRLHFCALDLVALNRVSKALYVVANEEEVWRERVLAQHEGRFVFDRDWKNTYATLDRQRRWAERHPAPATCMPSFAALPMPIKFPSSTYYSDELFQSFYCAHIDLVANFGDERSIDPRPITEAQRTSMPMSSSSSSTAPPTLSSSTPSSSSSSSSSSVPRCALDSRFDNIPRIHHSDLSSARFQAEFGGPNRPVIITGLMESWPCYGRGEHARVHWNQENWLRLYGDRVFKVGRYDMKLRDYFAYMNNISSDESPLYLFDAKFGEKAPELIEQYSVPEYFQNDYFELLQKDDDAAAATAATAMHDSSPSSSAASSSSSSSSAPSSSLPKIRPNYRWILVGPARSGSTFHKDPNHTSAWNALISGSKKWIMYPPDRPPPGVFASADHAEVCTPISVAEWFLNHYTEHRRQLKEHQQIVQDERKRIAKEEKQSATSSKRSKTSSSSASSSSSPSSSSSSAPVSSAPYHLDGPVEATCLPGEIIFIPNGWWHTALNLAPSFAVTQNYVNRDNIWNVCDFLESDAGEVDRNHSLLAALSTRLAMHEPAIASMVEAKKKEKETAKAEREAKEEEDKRRLKTKKKVSSLWERLTSDYVEEDDDDAEMES